MNEKVVWTFNMSSGSGISFNANGEFVPQAELSINVHLIQGSEQSIIHTPDQNCELDFICISSDHYGKEPDELVYYFKPDQELQLMQAQILMGESLFKILSNHKTITFKNSTDGDVNIKILLGRKAIYPTVTLTTTVGPNGNLEPDDTFKVMKDGTQTFVIKPDDNYEIDKVTKTKTGGTPEDVTVETDNTFKIDCDEDYAIEVTFKLQKVTITTEVGENGTLDPTGPQEVDKGSDIVFTATPADTFVVDKVTKTKTGGTPEDVTVETDNTFTITCDDNYVIKITFKSGE
ncbi:MAG: hypothetical protein JSV09_13705 [Thermoplasmata archaeon]|nr:MAG: hypothetical protein JSV09_13705 [Thermoplasmata archaeon]